MADQNVKINIGSSWNGQGVNKAMGAVDSLSKTAGKAAGAVGTLGTAFGGLDGKVGQAVGAVTNSLGRSQLEVRGEWLYSECQQQ